MCEKPGKNLYSLIDASGLRFFCGVRRRESSFIHLRAYKNTFDSLISPKDGTDQMRSLMSWEWNSKEIVSTVDCWADDETFLFAKVLVELKVVWVTKSLVWDNTLKISLLIQPVELQIQT